eukprot:1193312-Prorocentrum_minimum.AAC.1
MARFVRNCSRHLFGGRVRVLAVRAKATCPKGWPQSECKVRRGWGRGVLRRDTPRGGRDEGQRRGAKSGDAVVRTRSAGAWRSR